MLEVVAALVRREDCFLICRRPMSKARGGQWEFAGGKVEAGETMQQAVERELGVKLRAGGVVAEVVYRYPDLTVHLSLLEARIVSGAPRRLEHSEFAWARLDEMQMYDLCPADRALVRKLRQNSFD